MSSGVRSRESVRTTTPRAIRAPKRIASTIVDCERLRGRVSKENVRQQSQGTHFV